MTESKSRILLTEMSYKEAQKYFRIILEFIEMLKI